MSKSLALKNSKAKRGGTVHYKELLKEGIIAGIGWSLGVTIGFVFVSTVLVFTLKQLGGIPFVGGFIANVVEETQNQLLKRTVISPSDSLKDKFINTNP